MAQNIPMKFGTSSLRHCTRRCHVPSTRPWLSRRNNSRRFSTTPSLDVVKPFFLADIGEGITECQIIQWFVQPGARVEQFDKICEVQSDKASVEITSRFDGIIKKLHYEKDDVAKVGKPLLDIDIQSELTPEDEAVTAPPEEQSTDINAKAEGTSRSSGQAQEKGEAQSGAPASAGNGNNAESQETGKGKAATLATPAVRRITKELGVSLADVAGSGRDGRVLKEDVQRFASGQQNQGQHTASSAPSVPASSGEDKVVTLTAVQSAMYKTMTRSLSIPHFLYTDSIDFSSLSSLRRRLNQRNTKVAQSDAAQPSQKISALAFIVKAVSLAFHEHPHLNAHLDASAEKPAFTIKAAHNIGIAVDSPAGLVVPVIKNVQNHTITSLAAEITRLSSLAQAGKLANQDMQGATFTVSNVGSIGGTVVSPVIVSPQVAIVGIGKARAVPAFAEDGTVVRREECVFSWSADHRVLDGATVARAADKVRRYLENVEEMLVGLK